MGHAARTSLTKQARYFGLQISSQRGASAGRLLASPVFYRRPSAEHCFLFCSCDASDGLAIYVHFGRMALLLPFRRPFMFRRLILGVVACLAIPQLVLAS